MMARSSMLALLVAASGASAVVLAKAGPTRKALQRPSGMLTVSIEYERPTGGGDAEVAMLSMQLRRMDAAAIWTPQLPALQGFVKEQQTAKGDFPGPCPVVFSGDSAEAESAVAAGATAVTLGAHCIALSESVQAEIIWRVTNVDEIAEISEAGHGGGLFLVEGADPTALIAALPEGAFAIGSVAAMQEENSELAEGRRLAAAEGKVCRSVLLRTACVGDDEDVPYSQFAIERLSSKASTEFQISGLTGAANGHFGTKAVGAGVRAVEWARQK